MAHEILGAQRIEKAQASADTEQLTFATLVATSNAYQNNSTRANNELLKEAAKHYTTAVDMKASQHAPWPSLAKKILSSFNFYPQNSRLRLLANTPLSDDEALASDWNAVAGDMWYAWCNEFTSDQRVEADEQ